MKRRRIAGEPDAEEHEEEHQQQQDHFGERDDHEREHLAEQELERRDVRDVDLQDRLPLAFARHRQRGEQRREHRQPHHENAGAIELASTTAPGCTRTGPPSGHRPAGRAAGCRRVERSRDAAGVAGEQPGRVGVGSVHQQLDRRVDAARQIAAEDRAG